MADKHIKVEFTGDSSKFDASADNARSKVENLGSSASQATDKVQQGTEAAAKSVDNLGKSLDNSGKAATSAAKKQKSFNEAVAEAATKSQSFGAQAGAIVDKVGGKITGMKNPVDIIAQGFKDWGQVLKALMVDIPTQKIKDFMEFVKSELQSLKNTGDIQGGREKQLTSMAQKANEINGMADILSRRKAAETLIANATRTYGEGHGLSYDYATNTLQGAEGFETRVARRNAEREIDRLEAEIRTRQNLIQAEQERINRAEGGFLARAAKGEGFLGRGSGKYLAQWAQQLPGMNNDYLEAAKEKSSLVDEQAKARERLRELRMATPVDDILAKQRNTQAQKEAEARKAQMDTVKGRDPMLTEMQGLRHDLSKQIFIVKEGGR